MDLSTAFRLYLKVHVLVCLSLTSIFILITPTALKFISFPSLNSSKFSFQVLELFMSLQDWATPLSHLFYLNEHLYSD